MNYILIIGAVLNIYGGINMLFSLFINLPYSSPKLPLVSEINPPDYLLYRLFTAGVAFVFGSIYIYLYIHSEYVFPFLIFGTALKYWAFISSLVAYIRSNLPKDILISFGFSNLVVAILFSYYLYNVS